MCQQGIRVYLIFSIVSKLRQHSSSSHSPTSPSFSPIIHFTQLQAGHIPKWIPKWK